MRSFYLEEYSFFFSVMGTWRPLRYYFPSISPVYSSSLSIYMITGSLPPPLRLVKSSTTSSWRRWRPIWRGLFVVVVFRRAIAFSLLAAAAFGLKCTQMFFRSCATLTSVLEMNTGFLYRSCLYQYFNLFILLKNKFITVSGIVVVICNPMSNGSSKCKGMASLLSLKPWSAEFCSAWSIPTDSFSKW